MMQALARTVAISRQRGSGGTRVGREVAERLGLRCVDRQMLRDAAEYLRGHDSLAEPERTNSSWWSRIGSAFAMGGPDSGYLPPSVESVYDCDLFEIEERLIHEVVDSSTAVIIGRGAVQILRGRPGVLSVFLHAPEPWRIARVQDVYRLGDRHAAQQMVHESDRARAKFIQTFGRVDWTDTRGYDLAVDTAAVGIDAAVDLIVQAARARAVAAEAETASAG